MWLYTIKNGDMNNRGGDVPYTNIYLYIPSTLFWIETCVKDVHVRIGEKRGGGNTTHFVAADACAMDMDVGLLALLSRCRRHIQQHGRLDCGSNLRDAH